MKCWRMKLLIKIIFIEFIKNNETLIIGYVSMQITIMD